ncbi:MAG TPA: hypothetical protein VMF32_17165 [Xanthobacteraceae bacterium]|nr:hypothetical protein [Xanthobacteraceae bacterium]
MRAWPVSELFTLTRKQLFELYAQIAGELPALRDTERGIALENLRRIRSVLAHPQHRPP